MLKKSLKLVRNRLEGIDFLLRNNRVNISASAYARRRVHEGLMPFRQAWWHQVGLESYRTLRRYAHLLDWALAQPGAAAPGPGLPANARMLVFRPGHLGDILHLVPAVQEIKRQRPDIKIELITGPWNRDLVGRYDCFDLVHLYTPDVMQFHRGNRRHVRNPNRERQFIRELRGDGVDVVFCPTSPHFSDLPIIVGVQPGWYVGGEWKLNDLPVRFPVSTRPFDRGRYEMDAVADFLPMLGLERKDVTLDYRVSDSSRNKVRGILQDQHIEDKKYIVIFPGSGWPGKCWPADRFAQLTQRIGAEMPSRVVFGGSPDEKELCQGICAEAGSGCLNLAGELSIDESAALIESSALLIGNDSAPVHLAAAIGVPTVSLWGPTNPDKWAPRGPDHHTVFAGDKCAGCTYWHQAAACTGRPPCLTTISVDDVWHILELHMAG